jgi:uncharacterized membrane protein
MQLSAWLMKKYFFYFLFCSFSLLLLLFAPPTWAQEDVQSEYQEETLEGEITQILEEKKITIPGEEKPQLYQKLEVLVTKGSLKDSEIAIESGDVPSVNTPRYKVGDKVIISYSKDLEGGGVFYITDFIRRESLVWLFLIFMVLTVTIARRRGLLSLLGMGISFLVIFFLILPRILAGADPVETAILGSLIIIPITFFLSHGFNKKTVVAIAGTVLALVITAILAGVFVEAAKLTGFASEEAGFLQTAKGSLINIKGLLLAGIIIGVLGVLDDITISQSAIVFQLKEANEKLRLGELYRRAMSVGQDHISSMVNTLVLVYTGAALPLFLLFIDNPHPFFEIINYEVVAEEIVRMLVGSIGLILAVPMTTLIAVLVSEEIKHEKR